jgi:hypothetical protein
VRSIRADEAIGAARFNGVREEREAAASQMQRSLKAWRAASGPAARAAVPEGGGAPISSDLRARMEPKLGADLSEVKLHTGGDSAHAASTLGARAFTVGSDVHFNTGEFAPGTREGDKLLAHELTHVVQRQKSVIQRDAEEGAPEPAEAPAAGGGEAAPEAAEAPAAGGGAGGGEAAPAEVSTPGEPAEKEADAIADKVSDQLEEEKGDEAVPGAEKKEKKDKEKDKAEKATKGGGLDAAKEGAADSKEVEEESKQEEAAPEAAPAEEPAAEVSPKMQPGARIFRTVGGAPAADFNSQKTAALAAAAGITDLPSLVNVAGSLPSPLATNQGEAASRMGKLTTAISGAEAAWASDPATASQKKADFIDSRLDLLKGTCKAAATDGINGAAPGKPADVGKIVTSAVTKNFAIVAPEEQASAQTLNDMGGIYKVFDCFGIFDGMDDGLKAVWARKYGGPDGAKAAWSNMLTGADLPVAPAGMDNDPVVRQYKSGTKNPWPGVVNGFCGPAKGVPNLASKAQALDVLKLEGGRYPGPKMMVGKVDAAHASAGGKIGKPSMFYLLMFPDNVYVASDRTRGTTGGGAPELQAANVPVTAFLGGGFQLLS